MSAVVIPLASPHSVNDAWENYAVLARQLSEDATLLFDRGFNEELARRHRKWEKLFLIGERA